MNFITESRHDKTLEHSCYKRGWGYLFLSFRFIYFTFCMSVLHICMHGYHIHAWSLKRSEELELWMVASHHVGAKNPDHLQEQQVLLTTEPTF